MGNYWIVSSYDFVLHKTPESAREEAARLTKLVGKPFHVYCIADKVITVELIEQAPQGAS